MRISCPWLPALGLVLGLMARAPAGESPDVLVRQLAHPRYAEREKATRLLIEAGEPALPSLRSSLDSPDEESRQRAAAIIARIETNIRSTQLLIPPRLRIKITDKPISEAIKEVNQLARTNLSISENPGIDATRKISVDTGDLPYWEAMDAFLKAAGLSEDLRSPAPAINLNGKSGINPQRRVIINGGAAIMYDEPAVVVSTPRLAATTGLLPADSSRAIRIKSVPADHAGNKADPISGQVRVQLQVNSAPGLTIRELTGIDIRRAKAADGRSLELSRTTHSPEVGAQVMLGGGMVQQQVIIEDGTGSVAPLNPSQVLIPVTVKSGGLKIRELEELSGVLTARVMSPKDTLFTIDRVKEAGGRQFSPGEGMRVTFREATTRLTSTAVVRLTMEIDQTAQHLRFNVPFKGRNRAFIQIQRNFPEGDISPPPDFYLVTPDGEMSKALSVTASNPEALNDGSRYDLEILFDKPEKWAGVALVAKGRRMVTVNMPFTLKGVPMPDK